MTKYFVTGTDSNVGKTVTSAIITAALNAGYWKPIQSGISTETSEENKVKSLIDLPDTRLFKPCYQFKAPLSPDQAAALEGIHIDINQCNLPATDQPLVVEGIGGAYVPINENHCMLDVMQRLGLPIIVVARGTLGTINHTLLTIEALYVRKLAVKGVIFCGDLNHANQIAIERWGKVPTLFHIPRFERVNRSTIKNWVVDNNKLVVDALR